MFKALYNAIFGKEVPKPTARQICQERLSGEYEQDDVEITLVLLKALSHTNFGGFVETSLGVNVTSRYRTIDSFIFWFQKANASMLLGDSIEYGDIASQKLTISLDDYLQTNEGFVLNPRQVIERLTTCVKLYCDQKNHYESSDKKERANYYDRVFRLFFADLNPTLTLVFNHTH